MTKKKKYEKTSYICLLKSLHRTFRPREKPLAKQNSSNMNFCSFCFGDHFGLSASRAGSSDPFESGSNPDPKHSKKVVLTTCS
jgi:hypothetical protein